MIDQPQPSPTPSKPAKAHSDKAVAILAGAMQEFMTCGFSAASMDRIAVAAGVSKPTLYSYFRDKEGLFAALVQQIAEKGPGPSLPNLKALNPNLSQLPLRDLLRHMATQMLEIMSGEQPLFTLIRLIIGESGRFPELAQTFIRNVDKPRLEELTQLFATHPDSRASDPEVTARLFTGSIVHYVIVQEILHGKEIVPLERERFIEGLVDLMVKK
jgi:AcrR family transcriptional regulator